MSFDDDIRRTLRTEAGRYDPPDDGWDGITAGVRAARSRRRRIQGGILGAVAVAVVALGIGISLPGGGTDVEAGPFVTEPTVTTPPTSETTTPEAVAGPATPSVFPGIWPFASQEAIDGYADGDARFEDAAATAEAFARDYLGMLDPVVGAPEPGAAEGVVEVQLRPRGEGGDPVPDGGPSTVVTLRSFETSYGAPVWSVVGAASPNIVVREPVPAATVASPLAVRGEATGYEGTVVAEVRQDGMRAGSSLGRAVGVAGSMGAFGPLDLEVAFRAPTTTTGALVVTTGTGLDGVGVPEATVIRLAFWSWSVGEGAPGAEDGPCPAPPAGPGAVDDQSMEVEIHLLCDVAAAGPDPTADEVYVAVTRIVPRSAGVLQASLDALFAGTEPAEEANGLSSFFSEATSDLLRGVTIQDGTAIVDLAARVDNASTSTGSLLFRGQLNRTVLQFPTVERVEYRLGGSCEAFWEWQQVGGCQIVTSDDE